MNNMEKMLQINILAHNTDRIEFTRKSLNEIRKIRNNKKIYVIPLHGKFFFFLIFF